MGIHGLKISRLLPLRMELAQNKHCGFAPCEQRVPILISPWRSGRLRSGPS
jgi:hypothetical protein